MRQINSADLIEFYEGQVADPKRLLVEEFLLESQPGLMEYFAIKRDREVNDDLSGEVSLPANGTPSDLVRARLKRQVILMRGNFFTNRKSLMATAAAIIVIAGALYMREDFAIDENIGADSATTLSVDASSDLFAGATFL